ncbi:MAG: HD domain-containing phosphohydrolase [Acidobacteriota bacterium]
MSEIILLTYDTQASKSISLALRSNDYNVVEVRTVEEAAHLVRTGNPDLVILDIPNPAISFHRLQKLVENDIQFSKTPFIVFLPENTAEIKMLQKVAPVEFLRKPFEVNILLQRCKVLIEAKKISEKDFTRGARKPQGTLAEIHEFASIIKTLEEASRYTKEELERIKSGIKSSYLETAEMIVDMVEERDIFQAGHSKRVANYSLVIANSLGLDQAEKELLTYAALLHDIGKIFVSPDILGKPGALTEQEYELVKAHPLKGQRLLHSLSNMEEIADIILLHHEQPDGKGYYRKKAKEMPLLSKIIAVAEVFDAMTSSRGYNKPLSFKNAIAELEKGKGTKFDDRCVEALTMHVGKNNI